MSERPLVLDCDGEPLVAVLHQAPAGARLGVVVVVGGPQYRAGSHRQFVLLARAAAAAGCPCLRFDYRGMGDSAAGARDFRAVGDDIRVAVDALFAGVPSVERVVLWGLCDGASAALMYAPDDSRVEGVVAVNPWARSEATLAQARVRHYYAQRLFERELWKKIATGSFAWRRSLSAAARAVAQAAGAVLSSKGPSSVTTSGPTDFRQAMARGWRGLRGRVLFLVSGNDLTAQEFLAHACAAPAWRPFSRTMPGELVCVPEADHTFSSRAWNDALIEHTLNWLHARAAAAGDRAAAPPLTVQQFPEPRPTP